MDECGYCISLHFWIFICIGLTCLLECKHLALGSTRAQYNLLYCFLSARVASGSLSPLLHFRVSRLHLGQAPAISAENPLVIYSHHSIVPTPLSFILAICESWESFSASEGKVSEASFTPATGPVTRAAGGGCWSRGPTSQQAHVVFFFFFFKHGIYFKRNLISHSSATLWAEVKHPTAWVFQNK